MLVSHKVAGFEFHKSAVEFRLFSGKAKKQSLHGNVIMRRTRET